MSNNLDLWNAVEGTDPQHQQVGTISGQMRTMVRAQYKKKMITKALGVYGSGWGVVADSEKYERIEYPNTMLLVYTATAFYVQDEKQHSFPIASAIKEMYVTKGGNGYAKVDDEAIKKVRTDALTKGFTDLGFNADIFMGLWDDQDYVQGLTLRVNMEKEDEAEQSFDEARDKVMAYLTEQAESIETINNLTAYLAAMRTLLGKVRKRAAAAQINHKEFDDAINALVEARKAAEEEAQQNVNKGK